MAESLASQTHKALLERANRVPELVDKTYSKIEELKYLLCEESKLLGIDVTHTLKPILARQHDIQEKVLKSIKSLQNESISKSSGNHQQSPGRARALTVSVRNSGLRNGEASKPSDRFPHTKSLPTIQDREQLATIQPSAKTHNIDPLAGFKSSAAPVESSEVQAKKILEKDTSWYGSLDRNLVKKKKRNIMDRNRRHTKTVGSMAALEKTDYLQPDEQYEIGLPLDFSHLSVHSRSEVGVPIEFQMFPGPVLPPKSITQVHFDSNSMGRPKLSVLEPRMAMHWQPTNNYPGAQDVPPNSRVFKNDNDVSHRPSEISMTKDSNFKDGHGKVWFETNLDDSFLPSTRSNSKMDSHENGFDQTDSSSIRVRSSVSSLTNGSENGSRSSNSSETKLSVTNESSKPFEMSDYYKYSTKYRHHSNQPGSNDRNDMKEVRTNAEQARQTSTKHGAIQNSNDEKIQLNIAKGNKFLLNARDTNGNSGHELHVPELPPKQRMKGIRMSQDAAYLDEEVAWVMDSPTFV